MSSTNLTLKGSHASVCFGWFYLHDVFQWSNPLSPSLLLQTSTTSIHVTAVTAHFKGPRPLPHQEAIRKAEVEGQHATSSVSSSMANGLEATKGALQQGRHVTQFGFLGPKFGPKKCL